MGLRCEIKGCKAPSGARGQTLPGLCAGHNRQAWKQGVLSRLLDSNQRKTYRLIRKAMGTPFARYILKWARRTGKTFLLELIAIEECIRHASRRINVAAGTKESLKEFVWPTIYLILQTCPEDLRPHCQEGRGRITFRHGSDLNKSIIVLAGCNDKRAVERLRGPFAHMNIVEEAGAIPEDPGLFYILHGILNPQLLTTGGCTLIAGTPPKSSGHEFGTLIRHAEAAGEAQDEKGLSYRTLYDNPRMTPELVHLYLEQDAKLAGMSVEEYKQSPDYRREWLAIVETDPRFAILPNFTEERAAPCQCDGPHDNAKCPTLIWDPLDFPVFADGYVSMDIGFSPHWTAILYAYWDFQRQTLFVVGERILRMAGSTEIATAVRQDEVRLWGRPEAGPKDPNKPWLNGELTRPPFMRVADNNNPILLRDLSVQFDCLFSATAKDDKDAAVADVRRWIGEKRIAVSKNCPQLRAQMLAGVWNKAHTEFAESLDFGHYDLVDALVYMVRNVIPNMNRMPRFYGLSSQTHFYNPTLDTRGDEETAFRNFFTPG